MQTKSITITCPSCGHEFSPEAAIEGHLRTHLEEEYAEKNARVILEAGEKARAVAEKEFSTRLKSAEADAAEKAKRLLEAEKNAIALAEREKDLSLKLEHMDMEVKRQVLAAQAKMKADLEKVAYEKVSLEFQEREATLQQQQEALQIALKKEAAKQVEKARAEEQLKYAELEKRYEDQKRLADEMQRKAGQGSMQLQGEVQELAIETFLSGTFPKDGVEEIAKGAKGGDVLHTVLNGFGTECGRILYESKRTKSFSKDWIAKLKEDMRLRQADLGVIVTEAMPAEMSRFGQIDGIWICSLSEFQSVAPLLRYTLLRIGEVIATQENKGDKMQLLYEYLTGNEFRQRVEAISEAFTQMSADLHRERAQAEANFGKREKQLQKVLLNTAGLYGEVQGIAGGAVQSIRSLEMGQDDTISLREAS